MTWFSFTFTDSTVIISFWASCLALLSRIISEIVLIGNKDGSRRNQYNPRIHVLSGPTSGSFKPFLVPMSAIMLRVSTWAQSSSTDKRWIRMTRLRTNIFNLDRKQFIQCITTWESVNFQAFVCLSPNAVLITCPVDAFKDAANSSARGNVMSLGTILERANKSWDE